MAADGVERQRRRVGHGVDDIAIGHKTQFDERLKTVADAEHQAVASLQQVANGLGDLGGAEERGDELGGAVGLVATGEAAGDHNDLALANATCELVGALGNSLGREVVDHKGIGLGAGGAERAGGVVLAVVAGEHGDDHARTGDLSAAEHVDVLGGKVDLLDRLSLEFGCGVAIAEYALDAALPGLLQLSKVDLLVGGLEHVALNGGAEWLHDNALGDIAKLGILGKLNDKAAVHRRDDNPRRRQPARCVPRGCQRP